MIALLSSLVMVPPWRTIEVDLIEENITTNAETGARLHQIILYNWVPDYRRFDVVNWWIVSAEQETPVFVGGCAKVRHPVGCWIKSRLYRFTETSIDPEIEQRKMMPYDQRQSRI